MKRREIKFRVWDSSRNELVYPAILAHHNNRHSGPLMPLVQCGPNRAYKHHVLHQYTGFKDDETKKDIYEYDILRVFFDSGQIDSVVIFKEGAFQLVWFDTWDEEFLYEYIGNNRYESEVVGNIFQHPHLVKNYGDNRQLMINKLKELDLPW